MPNTLDYISFRLSQSSSENGRNTSATIHGISGTFVGKSEHQKYMVDIVAHALSSMGLDIDYERFTYTFPFHLS